MIRPPPGVQDAVGLHPEVAAHAQRLDLVLDQPLDRLVERALHLADAHRPQRRRLDAAPHQQLGEGMRLAGAAAAERAPCSATAPAAARRRAPGRAGAGRPARLPRPAPGRRGTPDTPGPAATGRPRRGRRPDAAGPWPRRSAGASPSVQGSPRRCRPAAAAKHQDQGVGPLRHRPAPPSGARSKRAKIDRPGTAAQLPGEADPAPLASPHRLPHSDLA